MFYSAWTPVLFRTAIKNEQKKVQVTWNLLNKKKKMKHEPLAIQQWLCSEVLKHNAGVKPNNFLWTKINGNRRHSFSMEDERHHVMAYERSAVSSDMLFICCFVFLRLMECQATFCQGISCSTSILILFQKRKKKKKVSKTKKPF